MADSFLDYLHENFPRAENDCFRRMLSRGHQIHFDKKTGKNLLPGYTEAEVFATLFLCKYYANQAGAEFVLTGREQEIFRGYMIPPQKRQ